MRRRRACLVVLVAAVLGGCSVSTHPRAQVADEGSIPFGLLDPEAPPLVPPTAPPGEDRESVALCFVRDGRLVEIERELEPPVTPQQAIAALASVPEDDATRARTALTHALLVRDVEVVAGVARVNLGESITDLGGEDQLLLVAQLVCTLTARPGIGQVAFLLEGSPVDVPRGDGSLVAAPLSRDDYRALLSDQ